MLGGAESGKGCRIPTPRTPHPIAAYPTLVSRYTVTPKEVAITSKAYTVNRKPPVPYDEIKTCWISFFSGIAPDALFAAIAAPEGLGHLPTKLDAFFAVEKCGDAQQIAMHMNPESDHFPGITFPFDDVEDFSEEWLDRLPAGSIVGVTFGCPCVDFSLMRLLRNYKGEIPDPIKARPGLNGPQGKLTRLCFWIWEAILQQHQPVLISENVPYTDLEDQWDEAERGWQTPAQILNSANHARSHRKRAWWILYHLVASWLDLFQPIDFDTALDPGWELDASSNCTLTASWTRGSDEYPEQHSERKMIIVNKTDGSTRAPYVHECERMMSYEVDSTAAPGITNRARMRALGNAWCFRTFFLIATYLFGWSPEATLMCDPDRHYLSDPAPITTHAPPPPPEEPRRHHHLKRQKNATRTTTAQWAAWAAAATAQRQRQQWRQQQRGKYR